MNKMTISTLLTIVFLFLGASCHSEVKSKLVSNLDTGKKQTVVAYGTSLTAFNGWVKQLQTILNNRYPGQAKVINSAMGGMWSKWGVANLDWLVIDKKPNTVFIEFAINDSYTLYRTSVNEARTNLENMIDRILNSNPNCEIILMVMNPPVGAHLMLRPKIKDYYQMYRDVARERNLQLIDHYPNWEKILNESPEQFNKYVPDGIHPTVQGSKIVTTPEIVRAIGIKNKHKNTSK